MTLSARLTRLCAAWVGIALALASQVQGGSAFAQDPAEMTIEQSIAQQEKALTEVRRRLHEHPEDAQAWRGLLMLQGMLAMMRHNALADGTPFPQAESRALRERFFAEWKAARPGDGEPFLAEVQTSELQGVAREEATLELVRRFPEQAGVVKAGAQVLRGRGEHRAAGELVEGYLARHPDDSEAYALVVQHHLAQENGGRAGAVLEEWIARFPQDLRALESWTRSSAAMADPEAARGAIERLAAAPPANGVAVNLCGQLLSAFQGKYRAQGLGCLREIAERAETDEKVRASAYESLLRGAALAGDWALVDAATEHVEAKRRATILLSAAQSLSSDAYRNDGASCPAVVALAERARAIARAAGAGSDDARSLAGALEWCLRDPRAEAMVLDLFANAAPAEVLQAWSGASVRIMRGSYMEIRTELPIGKVTAVLERRLKEEPKAGELWDALDQLYQAAGHNDRRPAHLRGWIAAVPDGRSEPYTRLMPLLLGSGDLAGAIALLESAPEPVRGDSRLQEQLLNAYLLSGQMEKAKTLGTWALQSAQSSDWSRTTAHRLLARAERIAGDRTAADEHYRAALGGEQVMAEIADEYLAFLAESDAPDGGGRLVATIEELCNKPGMRGPQGGPEECAADRLRKVGRQAEALRALQQAVEKAPDNAALARKLGDAAEAAEDWATAEWAFRRLVEIDPAERNHWQNLGASQYRRKLRQPLEELVSASQRQFGAKLPGLLVLLGKLYREQGEPRRSIDVLLEVKRIQPDYYMIDDELRQSYAALARSKT